jgi:hypothetical protein
MGFLALWSYALALVTINKRFAEGYFKLLRLQDKEDFGDTGVPLPSNYSLNNIIK